MCSYGSILIEVSNLNWGQVLKKRNCSHRILIEVRILNGGQVLKKRNSSHRSKFFLFKVECIFEDKSKLFQRQYFLSKKHIPPILFKAFLKGRRSKLFLKEEEQILSYKNNHKFLKCSLFQGSRLEIC